MITTDLDRPDRVLAIGAHPDDIEFGAAATLAKWAASGSEVHLLVLTDGSKGTWDANADIAELIASRELEQGEAARLIGARNPLFARQVDGELDAGPDQRAVVCETIRTVRPTVVVGHDPWTRHRIHPDHQVAGRLVVAGIVAARDPHFFPGLGGAPHRPSSALLFESDRIDHVERVGRTDIDAKRRALLAHESQWQSTMRIHEDRDVETERFARGLVAVARAAGARVGSAMGEAFLRIDDW